MAEKKRKTTERQDNVFPIFMKKTKREHNPSSSTLHESSNSNSKEAKRFTLKEFIHLLDLSSVIEEEEITNRMTQISEALLHDILLVARNASGKETEFEVLEAEFYLQIEGIHEDPFTHGTEEQRLSGRW
jgi:Fe2+ or Zn2+ uptake regulation protein